MDRLLAIETFVRVIDTGSFSATARILGIGQPAVSKAIAQLEEWLGVRLVLRSTRGLTPTEAGLSFYPRARRTIEEADEAVLAARGAAAGLRGRLRISAPVCFARLHIVPRLQTFLIAHPDLELELLLDDRNIDLVEEGVDVALRMGPITDPAMTVRKIAERPRLVVATPDYIERHGRPDTPSGLIGHQVIIYTRDKGGETFAFERGTELVSVSLSGQLRLSATEGLRAAVFAGIGLAVASEFAFSPELKSNQVLAVLTDWTLPPTILSAVYPTGRLASNKARAFVKYVEECLRA